MPSPRHAQERVGSSSTYRSGPFRSLVPMRFAAVHHDEKATENQHRGSSSHAHDIGDHSAVSSGAGVVVIAVQQYLVHDRPYLVLRRFDQAQANIFGGELNPVIVLSDLASGTHDH